MKMTTNYLLFCDHRMTLASENRPNKVFRFPTAYMEQFCSLKRFSDCQWLAKNKENENFNPLLAEISKYHHNTNSPTNKKKRKKTGL